MNKDDKFYTAGGMDDVLYSDEHEAVSEFMDSIAEEDRPATTTLTKWKRMVVEPKQEYLAKRVLSYVIEALDEDYGDPDGDESAVTDEMSEAAETFLEAIVKHYVPYICVQESTEEVRLEDYR